ncbi:hypothetical protein FH581_017160 (plasmid) [Leptospira weilii]|uniref:hypothetical protein n=1 Tax=Leptospira weilii TaxID=28184 RepID=UPI001EF31347|nr:hypothetical protein [Leptospira weilii]ULH29036.1 hypothetical protein FH586_03610 [Leptospira weilii]UPY80352.1 hypothetical protein FH581_024015 [Leptospira weilii]UPY80881.1 hypothetical protein FH581_017160 [Leptospira weilii]
MKGSRVLLNGKLIHRGGLWRRGRAMSERIGLIVIESKMTLRDIAWYYSQKCQHITPGSNYMLTFDPAVLSHTIKGTRNTPRYIKAIEESWGLPIADIRRIYREDKEFERQGRSLSREEINTFANWYIQTSKTAKAVS